MKLEKNSSPGRAIKKIFKTEIEKNTGFKTMKNILSILEGKTTSRDNTIFEKLTVDNKLSPMTSVDVKRNSQDINQHLPISVEVF